MDNPSIDPPVLLSSSPVKVSEAFGVASDMVGLSSQLQSIEREERETGRFENLTIRQSDEVRIVAAVGNVSKKIGSGSIYSVKVDLSRTGTLCIGVKDLPGNLLAVSMLKRVNGVKGAGEVAGVKLGDIIFGTLLLLVILFTKRILCYIRYLLAVVWILL